MVRPFIIPFFIPHQGCPHTCLFCDQRTITNRGQGPLREEINDTITRYLKTRKGSDPVIETAFFGGSFTALPRQLQEYLLESVEPFLHSGAIQSIRISTRPDSISPDILSFLKSRGVLTVELGAQSFDDLVLARSCRGHTATDTIRAVKLIHDAGLRPGIQLMPGLPGDTEEKSRRSAITARDLRPVCVRIYPTVVLRGTGLAKIFQDGDYKPLSMEEAVELGADMTEIVEEGGIPVIRIGIPPLSPGSLPSVVAGPYHPALGFLVRSRIRRRILESTIRDFFRGNEGMPRKLDVQIPFQGKEEYIGMKRENILYLESHFQLDTLKLLPVEGCDSPSVLART